jgi:putative flippase GtrA
MIVTRYSLCAAISILLNLFAQYIIFFVYCGPGNLYIAMGVGTAAGLISKYLLDKKYIFYYKPDSKRDDAKTFLSYIFMGLLTTCIFWGTEAAFAILFVNEFAKYIGAVIGLTIGYISKYFLDKKYVFKKSQVL